MRGLGDRVYALAVARFARVALSRSCRIGVGLLIAATFAVIFLVNSGKDNVSVEVAGEPAGGAAI